MTIDLFIDQSKPRRTAALLFEQIRDAIDAGRLRAGDRLPTSRDLAIELAVARSTVTAVYGRLTAEGFLEARTGDGTFVADHVAATDRQHRAQTTALSPRRDRATAPRPAAATNIRIDLRTGRPDPTLFPLAAWRRCVTDTLHIAPPGYGDGAGLPALRQAIAVWIRRSRGVNATSEQVIITAGAQHAFDLIARVMLAPGDTIAIENPGYEMARQAFEHHGLIVAPVPVDRDGIVVEQIPSNARAVYVTPSHQSPTGGTMAAHRRRALLAFADDHGAAIIEDDYDTEFRYVDRPLEPIQRLDTNGRVLYVGTFSKSLSPSVRLGFLIVPEPLVEPLVGARTLIDTQAPHITQAALAGLITSGGLDRHLRRACREYSSRHAVVARRIAQLHAEGLIELPLRSNAGLHNMITLHHDADADDAVSQLARLGLALESTAAWWSTRPQPGLMIGFGMADIDQLNEAFDHIAVELRRQHRALIPTGPGRT